MKKLLIVAILALSTLALSQTDPRLVATPTGYGLKPGTTSFSGLLGDLFTQNFGQLPAGGPPLGNFVVPCNQSGSDFAEGVFTAGCSITDVSGNTINTGFVTGGFSFFSLTTPVGENVSCQVTFGCQIGDEFENLITISNVGIHFQNSSGDVFQLSDANGILLTPQTGHRVSVSGPFTATGITDDGSVNTATCWKTATTLGHCTSVVAANGTCTCS